MHPWIPITEKKEVWWQMAILWLIQYKVDLILHKKCKISSVSLLSEVEKTEFFMQTQQWCENDAYCEGAESLVPHLIIFFVIAAIDWIGLKTLKSGCFYLIKKHVFVVGFFFPQNTWLDIKTSNLIMVSIMWLSQLQKWGLRTLCSVKYSGVKSTWTGSGHTHTKITWQSGVFNWDMSLCGECILSRRAKVKGRNGTRQKINLHQAAVHAWRTLVVHSWAAGCESWHFLMQELSTSKPPFGAISITKEIINYCYCYPNKCINAKQIYIPIHS